MIPVALYAAKPIVIDETGPGGKLIGNWADIKGNNGEGKTFSSGGCVGDNFHYTSKYGKWKKTGREKAIWTPNIPKPGVYKVEVSFRGTSNRTSKATYEVKHSKGTKKITCSQRTSGFTWKKLGNFHFNAGKSGYAALVGDGGSSACADAAKFTFVGTKGGESGPGDADDSSSNDSGNSSLSDVLNIDDVSSSDNTSISLNKENQGTKKYVLKKDEKLKVSAYLSSYGSASLKVIIKKKNGDTVEWLSWERADDKDPSPLKVNGKEKSASMTEFKPGDYSPKEQNITYKGKAGDEIVLSLKGDFGKADPHLKLSVKK